MKANQQKLPEPDMTTILSLATVVFTLVLLFLHNATLMAFAGAGLFSITLALRIDQFRSRRGSLKPAFSLLGFVWLCAAGTAVFSLLGKN